MPGILLFCHFGGHSYIYKNTEAGTNASVRAVSGNLLLQIIKNDLR